MVPNVKQTPQGLNSITRFSDKLLRTLSPHILQNYYWNILQLQLLQNREIFIYILECNIIAIFYCKGLIMRLTSGGRLLFANYVNLTANS